MKDSYDYFRKNSSIQIPRTPASALHGLEDGVLPPETYIYRATSVKPLFEEPIELSEIDRILGHPRIDIETILLITKILAQLIRNPDKETALFAAESINAIEKRYTERLEKIKKKFRRNKDPLDCRKLARLYFNLARINSREESIKRFYLRESHAWLKKLNKLRLLSKKEFILQLRVFMELGLYMQAERTFGRLNKRSLDPDILYLRAANDFYRKDFSSVRALCSGMKSAKHEGLRSFWMNT
ncbi:MAG: hypothetical protein E4H36_07905 [Spirochaetales bacterium]|nr:MAG: hypothetical protein E4H36_07905 [Spirochaetales bacterium]